MTSLDFSRFEALTFDCYGTLIDWETGIARALRIALGKDARDVNDAELLTTFARHEAAAEAGPYLRYRAVLARAAEGVAGDLKVKLPAGAAAAFGDSVGDWPAFADSTD